MAKDEEVYPFDFIPVTYDKHNKDKHYELNSNQNKYIKGEISFNITLKEPMVAIKQKVSYDVSDAETIPGSSIKGMLRNALEIVTDDRVAIYKDDNDQYIPDTWKNKDVSTDYHTLIDFLFGFVSTSINDDHKNLADDKKAYAAKSRLTFHDAALEYMPSEPQKYMLKTFLFNPPNDALKKGKYKRNKKLAGRKVYLSGDLEVGGSNKGDTELDKLGLSKAVKNLFIQKKVKNIKNIDSNKTDEVVIVPKGAKYSGKISFDKITKQDLALIIKVLELEKGTYHPIGKGKPLGLGRIAINVDNHIKVNSVEQDFFNLEKSIYNLPITKKELKFKDSLLKYYDDLVQVYEDLNPVGFVKSYGSDAIKLLDKKSTDGPVKGSDLEGLMKHFQGNKLK